MFYRAGEVDFPLGNLLTLKSTGPVGQAAWFFPISYAVKAT